jgi:glycerol-3-phosphate dehydrogenase
MQRDIEKLTGRTFDVLVLGGGIHGLTIAYDAAQRGLSVALVERADFGSGASFNHLRTIHGGLRYLQSLDLRRARESVRERRALARIAPHAVRPLPFALPLYRSVLEGKLAMRLGFQLDRLLAFDRNVGVPPAHRLPGGRVASRTEAIERFPGLGRRGLTGAAVWHDYTTPEADRLTLTWAIAAAEHGAVLANYVEAIAPLTDRGRVVGIRAADRPTGREIEVAATLTVNATAGSFDRRLPADISPTPRLKAMNLVTRRDAGDEAALGGRSASGRHLFLVPSRNRAVFGTWESDRLVAADESTRPTEADVSKFVAELNQAFPSLDLTLDDITLVHYGAVPAIVKSDGRVVLQGHDRIRDHAEEGLAGLLSVAGAKYTTARAVAERVTDRLVSTLRNASMPCKTASGSLPGGGMRDVTAAIAEARRLHDAGLPSDTIPHLVAAYGSRYEQVVALAAERSDWRARIADDSPVIGAGLVWAIRHEMVITLSDVVIRRTPLGAMGFPGEPALQRAADLVGSELGWSGERKRQEMENVRRFYSTGSA